MKKRLVVFAKDPVLGKAKTRLAKGVGIVHAKRHYRAMMAKILRGLKDPRWHIQLAVTPPSSIGEVRDWDGFEQLAQVSGSLSPRLVAMFQGMEPTLVIGTDAPQVTCHDIDMAFKALAPNRLVIGPADDGGFWLIGALGPLPKEMFDNIRWSHAKTLKDLEKNSHSLGYDIHYLRELRDIDDIEALRDYQSMTVKF